LTDLILELAGKAQVSVDVLSTDFAYPLRQIASLAANQLRLRCVIRESRLFDEFETEYFRDSRCLADWGWEVRKLDELTWRDLLVVDDSSAVITLHESDFDLARHRFLTSEGDVRRARESFESFWTDSTPVVPLYASDFTYDAVRHVSIGTWSEVLRVLRDWPQELLSLDSRRFEELIAELLSREGMGVQLTPAARDGGRDILAFADTIAGRHLYLVECKRYRPDRPVRVGWVRSLYGVVEHERATAGILVTTSYFTQSAQRFAGELKNRISLKDYEELVAWLRKIKL
jgi:Restriction endonuclease